MGIASADIPAGLSAGVKALFMKTLEETPSHYKKLAMVVPSNKSEEQYAWLATVPGMREFIDERQVYGLREFNFTIANKTWESTIEVERAAMEDEQYGQIKLRIQSLAEAAVRHKEKIIIELAQNGFLNTCYDEEPFFSNAHPASEGTASNIGTDELSAEALQSAISHMAKTNDESGNPMGITADTLLVPPDLEWRALEIVTSVLNPETADNKANTLKGRLDVIVSPHLVDSNNWFLFATKGALKPFILQERTAIQFSSLDATNGADTAFMRDRLYYGVRARYNAGYGLWRLAYGSQVTGN